MGRWHEKLFSTKRVKKNSTDGDETIIKSIESQKDNYLGSISSLIEDEIKALSDSCTCTCPTGIADMLANSAVKGVVKSRVTKASVKCRLGNTTLNQGVWSGLPRNKSSSDTAVHSDPDRSEIDLKKFSQIGISTVTLPAISFNADGLAVSRDSEPTATIGGIIPGPLGGGADFSEKPNENYTGQVQVTNRLCSNRAPEAETYK